MQIELRSVHMHKGLSQETPAYTAKIYVDGVLFAQVENQGHGGCDYVHHTDAGRKLKDAVDAYFAAMPHETYQGIELAQCLEMWCHGEVYAQDAVKTLKRQRKVIAVLADGQEVSFKKVTIKDLPKYRDAIVAKNPGIKFVCEMSDNELRALVTRKETV